MSFSEPELLVDMAAKAAALAKQLFVISDDLADAFGSELAQLMASEWGGQGFNFPKGAVYRVSKLHQDVWAAFNGTNHNELAKRFNISRVWVYQIVKRMRAADLVTRQPDLFKPPEEPDDEPA